MKVKTRDFGIIDVNENDFITFKEPILGFDDSLYTIISVDEIGSDFVFLQSVNNENVCFILVNPNIYSYEYKPTILSKYKKELGIISDDDLVIFNIGVIYDDFKNSTVNLKSPILMNTQKKLASQVILDDDYPLKAPIYMEMEGKKC